VRASPKCTRVLTDHAVIIIRDERKFCKHQGDRPPGIPGRQGVSGRWVTAEGDASRKSLGPVIPRRHAESASPE
jgi:hypothetical protein